MNKRAKVHMLPTENETSIVLFPHHDINQLQCYKTKGIADKGVGQHLYFTTDEEIKVGDYYTITGKLHPKPTEILQMTEETIPEGFTATRRKIIATTDPKLIAEGVAQPSQAFIKAYCEQGGIDEVDVEYGFAGLGSKKGEMFRLKVDSTHNTITIHLIKEKVYSREKVEELIHKFNKDQAGFPWHSEDALKWINENL
jgi:hypothetical protein